MLEVFDGVSSLFLEILSLPLIRLVLFFPLLLFPFSLFSRLMDFEFGDVFSVVFSCIGTWIKNKFIDLLKKLFGFDFIYKHGLARPGVDYVECDSQFCGDCPFQDTCPAERQAQFSHLGKNVSSDD